MRTLQPRHALLALLALTALSLAVAQEAFEVALAVHPAGGAVVAVHGTLPLFEVRDVQHAVRVDVAYAFESLPGLTASYLLRDTSRVLPAPYLGTGAGIALPDAPAASPQLSAHAIVGFRVPLAGGLGAFGEAVVAGNAFGSRLDLGVGVAYAFGGTD